MPKSILIALTNPVSAARDADFNRWYNEVHADDILSLPTVSSITRYRSLRQIRPHDGEPTHRYLAVYEMDNPHAAVEGLIAARPSFAMSDAMASDPVAMTFVPIFSKLRT